MEEEGYYKGIISGQKMFNMFVPNIPKGFDETYKNQYIAGYKMGCINGYQTEKAIFEAK